VCLNTPIRKGNSIYTKENPRDIIILAMGPSRGQCPYDAEVYSLNMGYQQIAHVHGKISKIFMVHKQVVSPAGTVYFKWDEFHELHNAGCELWNIHDVPCERCGQEVPFKKYPLDDIVEKFGLSYFSDTVCYMVAFALNECTKGNNKDGTLKLKYPLKLRFYGVDLLDPEEYGQEKGGVECWIGYALGLGVDVQISSGSSLLLTYNGSPYGIEVQKFEDMNPYTVLTTDGSMISEDEFQKNKEEIFAKLESNSKDIPEFNTKYQGENSPGMRRMGTLMSLEDFKKNYSMEEDGTIDATS